MASKTTRQLTVIRGQIYDITNFADKHPGGKHLLSLAVGRDSTVLFESYHIRNNVAEDRLAQLPKVKDVSIADLTAEKAGPFDRPPNHDGSVTIGPSETIVDVGALPNDSDIFKVIRQRVRKEIVEARGMKSGRGGLFWNTLSVLAFWVLCMVMYLRSPSVLMGCLLGLAGVWVGVGMQHTANHGGLARSPIVNALIGFGDDIACGGSSLVWRYHHHVSHHAYTNILHQDQDVFSSFPLMRFDEEQALSWWHRAQAFYAPLSFSFLYWSVQMQDVTCVLTEKTYGVRFLGLSTEEKITFWTGKAIHFFLYLVLPIWWHGLSALKGYFGFTFFGSIVLAWVFIVSHNTEEVKPSAIDPNAIKDWGRWQIETSVTWGGPISAFFMGGLNYQIEHHLFPGMAHNLYPLAAKIVEEECAKRNIPYHYYGTLWGITVDMMKFLHLLGHRPQLVSGATVSNKAKKLD